MQVPALAREARHADDRHRRPQLSAAGDELAPVNAGHHEVGQEHVELGGRVVEEGERLRPALRLDDAIPVPLEHPAGHVPHERLVVDQEHRVRDRGANCGPGLLLGGRHRFEDRGSRSVNVEPDPGRLSTSTCPSASRMMSRTIARPSPMPAPCALVEKNGSKIRPSTSGAMPTPRSTTSTET